MYIKSRNFKILESEAIVHACTDIYNNLKLSFTLALCII